MSAGSSISPVSDFTSLDYASINTDLFRFVQSKFGVNLTNYNPSDPLVVVVGMLSYLGDLLAYTENQHTQEGIPVRALRMENFRDAVKPLNFTPKGPSPATATISVTLDPVEIAAGSITITPAHRISTRGGVVFQPTSTTVFPMGGATSGVFDVQQGETLTETLAAASPGSSSQSYYLSQYPVLVESIRVLVDGIEWTLAEESVAIESPTSPTYDLHFDADWRAKVVFGDGANGLIPPVGLSISVIYATCAGAAGSTAEDTITTIVSMPNGVETVTNPVAASSGADPESLASAKARLPGVARANNRAVSFLDYAAEATQVSGISKAIAVKGKNGTGGCGCPVVVYAAPPGGGSLTPTLRSQVVLRLRNQGMTGRRIVVRDASIAQLSVEIDIYVSPKASASDTQILVQNEVLNAYDFASLDFGVTLPIQSLYDLLLPASVKGIARVFVRKFTILPSMGYYPQSTPTGTGSVVYPVTNASIHRREWKVTITSGGGTSGPAVFTVVERVLGVATEVSNDSLTDESAHYEVNYYSTNLWSFRYRPYDTDTSNLAILGNTSTGISLDSVSSLQDLIQPQEDFCLELATGVGGISYRDSWVVPGGGYAASAPAPAPYIIRAPGSGWAVGDSVHIISSSGLDLYATITGGSTGLWEVNKALPAFTAGVTITMTAVWDSGTGFKFEVIQGDRRWEVGDTFFVDTYPQVEDLNVRNQSYPALSSANLVIQTIGGRT